MGRYRLLPGLALIAISPAWSAVPLEAITAKSPTYHGGYQILSEFTVDSEKHAVISPPAGTSAGDLLWIRPRLNADEYLVLQKCKSADCSDAQVVRAWNAAGAMGPYVIVSNKARIEAGAKYMIWMQRISVKGGDIFPFYLMNSPPLIFAPAGPARIFAAADLKGAQESGPSRIIRSANEGSSFVARFEGGSVVRMEMLRADGRHAESPGIVSP